MKTLERANTVYSNVQVLHGLMEKVIRAEESKDYERLAEFSLMVQEVAGVINGISSSIRELDIVGSI